MVDTLVYEKQDSLSAIALLSDGDLCEIDFSNDKDVAEGSVYLGKITSKLELPNGKTAFFVNIGDNVDAFLNSEEDGLEENLAEGQSLVVQVLLPAREEKGAKIARGIKLAGENLVYCPYQINIGVSSKIREASNIEEYKRFVIENTTGQEGWILRTSSVEVSFEKIAEEMILLREKYESIRNKAKTKIAPTLLYSKGDSLSSYISEYKNSIKKIVVNNHNVEKELAETFKGNIDIIYSTDPFDDYGLEEIISDSLLKEVKLKNGGSIFIEETKACVAIDVDSGADFGGGPISRLNIEAAIEIAKQIRLRNLAGKIIIDFAGSTEYRYLKPVLDVLHEELQKDSVRCYFAGLSKGGNVELIRSRRRPSLRELMTEECSCCQGTGRTSR